MKVKAGAAGAILPIIGRHWFKALFVAALMFGCVITAYIFIPTQYNATASIIVALQDHGFDTAKHISQDKLGDPADLESQLLVVRSTRVLRLALATPNAQEALARECRARPSQFVKLSCDALAKDMDRLRDAVSQKFAVGGAGRSRVINITYTSPLPDVAQAMANSLTTTFLNDRMTSLTNRRVEAASQLRARLSQLENALRADEDSIQKYKRENGLQRGATGPVVSERLSGAIQALSAAEASKADAAARMNILNQGEDFSESANLSASRTIGDLKQQLTLLDAQIANESNTLGPLHPALQSLAQQRALLKRRLDAEIANLAASTKRRFSSATRTSSDIASSLNKLKAESAETEYNESKIGSILRSADAKRAEIADLGRKIADIEIQRRTITTGVELVSLAELPIVPFFPKLVPFLAVAILMGLISAAGVILLAERRRRIALGIVADDARPPGGEDVTMPDAKTPDASETWSGRLRDTLGQRADQMREDHLKPVPILAQFPRLPLKSAWVNRPASPDLYTLLTTAHGNPAFRQNLDTLKAIITTPGKTGANQSILCLSAHAGIGKTTTIMALADYCAALGARVLVIETDLLRPRLASQLKLRNMPGLTPVLAGAASLSDSIVRVGQSQLFILPAGNSDPFAGSLLVTPAMGQVLQAVRAFDLVLIDAASDRELPMSGQLRGHVDAALYFGSVSEDARQMEALAGQLSRNGVRLLGKIETLADAPEGGLQKKPLQWAAA